MKIKILDAVINRLILAKQDCSGEIFGYNDTKLGTIYILALQQSYKSIILLLPTNIESCGGFDVRDSKICLTLNFGNNDSLKLQINARVEEEENVKYEKITQQDLLKDFIWLRVKGEQKIQCNSTEKAVLDLFSQLKTICLNSCVFKFFNSKILFTAQGVAGIENGLKIEEFYNTLNDVETVNSKKKVNVDIKPKILNIEILWKKSLNKKAETEIHAPVCVIDKNASRVIDTVANIDTIVMVPSNLTLSDLYSSLSNAVNRFLKLFEQNLLQILTKNCAKSDSTLQTFHFFPKNCAHFLTILYPKNTTEDDLKSFRLKLHKDLMLEEVIPMFRRANQFAFENSNKLTNSILTNPHENVKLTNNGGQISLVRGKYEYYHYCQNNSDDSGWGCAYRSLQTLASWFKLQGYVDKPVPTIQDIQKCLVDIKDKPSNFIGSKQWIGSTEVSFVLSSLLGIESRIVHVSSGEEMSTMGDELMLHFETQGSPVMIGGGVLAHTILGVDYNQETGGLKFLILDPHYTGIEDLNVVINKGWCGWKGTNFWDKTSYYNMCLPQVP